MPLMPGPGQSIVNELDLYESSVRAFLSSHNVVLLERQGFTCVDLPAVFYAAIKDDKGVRAIIVKVERLFIDNAIALSSFDECDNPQFWGVSANFLSILSPSSKAARWRYNCQQKINGMESRDIDRPSNYHKWSS
jgi:hypothetical protein